MKAKNLLLSILLAGTCLVGCDMPEFLKGNKDPDVVEEDKTLQSVSVDNPTKMSYYIGEEFDSTGMKVYANYSDGTKEIVAAGSYTVSGFDSSVAGTTTVTITYNGKTTTISLSVVELRVASIEVTSPTKTTYQVGEQLDTAGMVVTATYDNSAKKTVAVDNCEITGFDSSHAGSCEVTVAFEGKTAKFTVTIVNPTLESITVTEPTKTIYQVGEQLDLSGMTVTANYSNDTTVPIDVANCAVTGFDSSISGTNLITVTYEGHTDTFVLTIVDPVVTSIEVTAPTKSQYFVDEELETAGMSVVAYYSNSTHKDINLDDCVISGFDSSESGVVTVTVTYEEKSDTFEVTIVDPVLTSVAFTAPTKLTYRVGESLDTAGMTIVGTYNDGKDRDISIDDCVISGFDSSEAGTKTVTVTIGDFEKTFDVTFEAAPEAIECTMSFDTPDDLENLSMSTASAAVWNISQTISNSHDGVGSLKISPTNNSGQWPQLFFGKGFNLTNVAKVEMWIYAEGNDTLKNMALMFKKSDVDGSQYSYYPEVTPGEWVKYEVLGSTLASKIDDLSSVDIYLGNNGSTYANRCVFYVDSFNLVNYPAVTNLVATINKNIRVGAELNKDDINVVATFDDDSNSVIALNNCEISGFDSSVAGTKELTVTYKGKSTTCSYTVEEAPAAVSVIHGFDNAEDVASIPGSNDNNCWPIGFTNSISHDGVGSLKIDPDRASTTKWPLINLGEYDLSNAELVEYWVYFDSDNAFNTFAIFAKEGDTTKASKTIKVESRTWTKFSLSASDMASKFADPTKVRICFAQNGGTYPDRSSIYLDSLNIVNYPTVTTLTAVVNKNIRLGAELNKDDLSITATYDNDSVETVALSNAEVTGFDSSSVGTKELTVKYKGKTTTCSYTVEEAPATVSVTHGFDNAEDVAAIPGSNDNKCWPIGFTNSISHDGVGSLKIDPDRASATKWPKINLGDYDLSNAKSVEYWVYFDSDNAFNTFAIFASEGETTKASSTIKVESRTWTKFSLEGSAIAAKVTDITNVRIYFAQNGGTYPDRSSIYIDSFNIINNPVVASLTATMNKNIRVGGSLSDTNISITATYDNDETEKVSLNSCTVEGFDSSTAGTKEMTITYKGKSTTCSYTIEEAPAAVSVTNGFDSAEDVAKLPAGSSSDVWCWPRAFSTEMSHDGAGSLKVTPHKTDGSWPGVDFGAYDLTNAKKVEIWAYVDGDEGLNNIAIRLKAANTTNVYTSSKNLPAREWFKFEIDMKTVTATPEQLANMNIWVFQNNGTYTNRCPIYFDSLNVIEYPAAVSVTKSFDTADDVTSLPEQTSNDKYAWSLSHSTELSHDGAGSLKITPLNRGTTWPALNLGAYDLSNISKIELWAYADSDDDLPNMRLRLKLGSTVKYDLTKTLTGHQWIKFEVNVSETNIAAEDLKNINIWFYQSGSSYTNKCPIYIDSLNLIECPPAVSITKSFDTADDVTNLPAQTNDDKYAWSLSHSTELSHDGAGSLKITPLNRGTTWPALNLGAYDLSNISKIELWAYADSDDDLPNMRLRLKLGSTAKYDLTKTLTGHQWVKFEVNVSETNIAAGDLENINIWFYQSGSSYTNKCPIYIDSLNLIPAE